MDTQKERLASVLSGRRQPHPARRLRLDASAPPSLVERLARLADPRLPAAAVAYTRNVTRVWCVFFACNALAALATCLRGDLRLWTLYNGAVSYLLIGLLMAGEWFVRRRFMSRHAPSTP